MGALFIFILISVLVISALLFFNKGEKAQEIKSILKDIFEDFMKDLFRKAPFDVYMCGHDHNKQLITTNIKGKPITMIVCGSGGKVYDDENDLSQLPNIKDLEFVSDNLGYGYCEATPTRLTIKFMNDKNKLEYAYKMEKVSA